MVCFEFCSLKKNNGSKFLNDTTQNGTHSFMNDKNTWGEKKKNKRRPVDSPWGNTWETTSTIQENRYGEKSSVWGLRGRMYLQLARLERGVCLFFNMISFKLKMCICNHLNAKTSQHSLNFRCFVNVGKG